MHNAAHTKSNSIKWDKLFVYDIKTKIQLWINTIEIEKLILCLRNHIVLLCFVYHCFLTHFVFFLSFCWFWRLPQCFVLILKILRSRIDVFCVFVNFWRMLSFSVFLWTTKNKPTNLQEAQHTRRFLLWCGINTADSIGDRIRGPECSKSLKFFIF